MAGGIFLLHGDDELVAMREQPYDSEDVLQALLARFPALLAGDETGGARRWMLVAREAALPDDADAAGRWSIDHLFLDQDSVPTLVEVKRSSDTRIRREVVGQMLDYAANAVAWWPAEEVRSLFLARCDTECLDPDTELSTLIGEAGDAEEFWQRTGANLGGRLRLVFVSDEIPRELRRVIEFLNEQMRAEVLGIEVKQYVGEGGVRTLVPRVLGQTAASETRRRATPTSRQWNEPTFFAALDEHAGPQAVAAARAIYDWCLTNATEVGFGRGAKDGSFVPTLRVGGSPHPPIAVYSYGRVEVQFQHLIRPPYDDMAMRERLREQLNEIPGVSFGADVLTRRPSLQLADLGSDRDRLDGFLRVLDWFKDTLEPSGSAASE